MRIVNAVISSRAAIDRDGNVAEGVPPAERLRFPEGVQAFGAVHLRISDWTMEEHHGSTGQPGGLSCWNVRVPGPAGGGVFDH